MDGFRGGKFPLARKTGGLRPLCPQNRWVETPMPAKQVGLKIYVKSQSNVFARMHAKIYT